MRETLEILITQKQLDAILKSLAPSWVDTLLFPFIVGLAIAICSVLFQLMFQKNEEKKDKIKEAQNFNEALIYTGTYLENIASSIHTIILPEYKNTSRISNQLNNSLINPHLDNTIIPSFKILNEDRLISKIPNRSEFISFMQIYYRTEQNIEQFNSLCKHRLSLGKKLHSENGQEQSVTYIIDRFNEIHDSTEKLLFASESILDGLLSLEAEFEKMGNSLRKKLKEEKISNIDIYKLEKNELYHSLLKELNSIFDAIPAYKDRQLHIPRS